MDNAAQLRDNSFNFVSAILILSVFVTAAIALLAISKYPQLRRASIFAGFVTLSMSIVPYLMTPFMLKLSTPIFVTAMFLVVSLMLGFFVYWLGQKFTSIRALFGFSVFIVFVLLADIFSGGNLQFNSLFGNASIVAGRFAGFGNMAYSILSMSSIVIVATLMHLKKDTSKQSIRKVNWLLVLFLVLILIAIGLPIFGSDVGGVLAFTPTVFIISMMMFDKKINLKTSFIAFGVTLLAISVFSVFDLNRPVSERTHLGRFVQVLADGEALVVIERKLVSNLSTLTTSLPLTIALLGAIYLLFLLTKPEDYLRELAKTSIGIRYLVYPGILLAILSMLLNDSGIAIGGMMAAIAIPAFVVFSFTDQHLKVPQRDLADKNV